MTSWRIRRPIAVTRRSVYTIGLLVATCSGCGDTYKLAPVSGRITLDGRPIQGIYVTFQPVGGGLKDDLGPASYGHTDTDGRYQLKTIDRSDRDGAVVGSHRVILQQADQPREETVEVPQGSVGDAMDMVVAARRTQRQQRMPTHYRDGSLQFEVPAAGTIDADFDLASGEP